MIDHGRTQPTFQLRRKAAINIIKAVFLGNEHIAGDPQSKLILPKLWEIFPGEGELNEKTWNAWNQGTQKIQDGKLRSLNAAFASKTGLDDYISSLIRGDNKYWTLNGILGAIVRHFDALDAAAYFGEKEPGSWQSEKNDKSKAVLENLHTLWNPSLGEIYKTFRSDHKIEFDLANDEERLNIEKQCHQLSGFYFQFCMNQQPKPRSEVIEYFRTTEPTSVVPFLWWMAIDKDFLQFERMDIWCMDLASASAAFYGLGYANRYEVFGARAAPETSQISAMDELLWTEKTDFETVLWHGGISVAEQKDSDAKGILSRLWDARNKYHSQLAKLGITPIEISQVLKRQWSERPIVYSPHAP